MITCLKLVFGSEDHTFKRPITPVLGPRSDCWWSASFDRDLLSEKTIHVRNVGLYTEKSEVYTARKTHILVSSVFVGLPRCLVGELRNYVGEYWPAVRLFLRIGFVLLIMF